LILVGIINMAKEKESKWAEKIHAYAAEES